MAELRQGLEQQIGALVRGQQAKIGHDGPVGRQSDHRLCTLASSLMGNSARGRNSWGSTLSARGCYTYGGHAKALTRRLRRGWNWPRSPAGWSIQRSRCCHPDSNSESRIRSDGPASRPPGCPGSRRRAGCVWAAEGSPRPYQADAKHGAFVEVGMDHLGGPPGNRSVADRAVGASNASSSSLRRDDPTGIAVVRGHSAGRHVIRWSTLARLDR